MRKFLLPVALALFLAACGESNDNPVATQRDAMPTKNDTVAANSQLLADALERYAAGNAGNYPRRIDHVSEAGSTLVDYLSAGEMLVNPFTGEMTEPQICFSRPEAGSILFEPMIVLWYDVESDVPGYRITGYGDSSVVAEIVVGPDSLIERDQRIIENCLLVIEAVEEFARQNGGVYPGDLSDTDQNGDTVFNLLPDGEPLVNPYSLCWCEPQDGAADEPGETGYVTVTDRAGTNIGYAVNGWGMCREIFSVEGPPSGP